MMTLTNRRSAAMLVIVGSVAACSDPVAEATRKYEAVKHSSASAEEICARGRTVPDAYLERGDTDGYRKARLFVAIDCDRARMDDAAGMTRDASGNTQMLEPDDMSVPFNELDRYEP